MSVGWKRRKRGTYRQRGKPFPIIGKPVIGYPPRRMKIRYIERPAKEKFEIGPSKSISAILSGLDVIFPQFMPLFRIGRIILNNREFFFPIIRTVLSRKTNQEKLKTIEQQVQRGIERKAIPQFSKASSKAISELVGQQVSYEVIAKIVDPSSRLGDAELFQSFFESTLEEIIRETTLRGLGNIGG